MPYELILSERADRDFMEIINWSARQFGERAADRYESLLGQALIDLADDPFRPGSKARDELSANVYSYHLRFSRDRVRGEKVKTPRHFVMYRVAETRVEVLRLLHDSRDLARHLPED